MSDPVPVYLGHSLGGGAEHWLEGRIARHTGQGHGAVVLRVGGAARWQLEVHGPAGSVTGWTEDFTLITRLLALLPACRIVYSCGVGDRDPVSLPAHLLALYRGAQDRIDVMMHDYFPISPSFTLLDSRGRYQGLPDPSDPAHQARRADGTLVSLQDWQNNWHALLSHAARLRCFSADSARLLTKAWPDLAPRIVLEPHDLTLAAPVTIPVRARPPACPLVAVLGNIAPHKGAGLVQQLARLSPQARGFDLMLLGNIDPAYPLPARFRVHGQYRPADIPRLAQHYGITHWLIPSLWPETFSFTTHEALATGLPTLAFDIGAQGDAVRQSANGVLLPYDPHGDLAGLVVHGVDWGSRS
jgi:glycosyltransferase involved in cell wall biosynthesis